MAHLADMTRHTGDPQHAEAIEFMLRTVERRPPGDSLPAESVDHFSTLLRRTRAASSSAAADEAVDLARTAVVLHGATARAGILPARRG